MVQNSCIFSPYLVSFILSTFVIINEPMDALLLIIQIFFLMSFLLFWIPHALGVVLAMIVSHALHIFDHLSVWSTGEVYQDAFYWNLLFFLCFLWFIFLNQDVGHIAQSLKSLSLYKCPLQVFFSFHLFIEENGQLFVVYTFPHSDFC